MRILLADDQPEVRSAMRLLLEQESGLSIVAEAVDADSVQCRACEVVPDVVLLDWELPGEAHAEAKAGAGGRIVRALRLQCPLVKVVALSGRPEARQAALCAGADAFVSKGDPPEQLMGVLRSLRAETATGV